MHHPTRRTVFGRRVFLTGAAAVVMAGFAGLRPAMAQAGGADAFVKQFADALVGTIIV